MTDVDVAPLQAAMTFTGCQNVPATVLDVAGGKARLALDTSHLIRALMPTLSKDMLAELRIAAQEGCRVWPTLREPLHARGLIDDDGRLTWLGSDLVAALDNAAGHA